MSIFTQGKRVELKGDLPDYDELQPGCYSRDKSGRWWARTPLPESLMSRLDSHTVVEHEDKTITVSPSILVTGPDGKQWHGYLERGVWREI